MATIIDLTDLLDPEDAAALRADLKKQGHKFAGPKQKLHRPAPMPPPYKGMKKDRVSRQVIFWTITTCKCGSTTTHSRDAGQLFNHIIDSPHTSHYTPATTRLVGIPKEVEWTRTSVAFCPNCIHSPIHDDFVSRMNAYTQRELNPCARDKRTQEPLHHKIDTLLPVEILLGEKQTSFDFSRWTYKPSRYPLVVAGPATAPLKGLRYVKARRTWLARSLPRFAQALGRIEHHAECPYPFSQI